MNAYAILDERDRVRGAFLAALGLHVSIVGALVLSKWLLGHAEPFGAKDAGGGAIGIEAVDAIPLPHTGPKNPVANDSESEVPQAQPKPKPKAQEKVKAEIPPPDAIRLKTKDKKVAKEASVKPHFKPFDPEPNQLTSQQAPAVSSPLYTQLPGSGRIGLGANTTLGTRFAEYGQRIRQIVSQHWRTSEVDASRTTAPPIIVTFDLKRDGTASNVKLLQKSGIPSLDNSVERAILEASPFPPIPKEFDRSYATVEFNFELKR